MNIGLLFGIIFAAIVMGFVLFFGYTQFSNMACIQGESITAQQIVRLERDIDDVFSMAMDSSQEFDFIVGTCTGKVCFVDADDSGPNPERGWDGGTIYEELVSTNGYNLFIMDEQGRHKDGKKIEHMIPDENFCISASSSLLLTNRGRSVEVSIL